MKSNSLPGLADTAVYLVLRIQLPWYADVPVVADVFGDYNVQFAAVTVEGATRLYIAAFPRMIKGARNSPNRPVCALSGTYETQPDVIRAWENGFEVIGLDDERPAHLTRALVNSLIKMKHAEEVRIPV